MVDTAVRPRPNFMTFLKSDTNAKSDAFSIYEYKRELRANKVALLQEKQAQRRVPGYKLPLNYKQSIVKREPAKKTDAVAQTDKTAPTVAASENEQKQQEHAVPTPQQQPGKAVVLPPGAPNLISHHNKASQTVHREARQIMSAKEPTTTTLYGHTDGCRPQTARETDIQYRLNTGQPMTDGNESNQDCVQPNIESLVSSYTWTSATKRGYNDVNWKNKLPPPLQSPAPSISRPDSVSLRFDMKRYFLNPHDWQNLGNSWDECQSRPSSAHGRSNSFCSPFKNTSQLPGYLGYICNGQEADNLEGGYCRKYSITSAQPRTTNISRHGNIPGYKGCTHWTSNQPSHTKLPYNHPTTNDRMFRTIPLEEESSPFMKTGVFSKMITLTSPYNPFNKKEPSATT